MAVAEFDGETITLKNHMTFEDDTVNFAQFKAVGTNNKSFMFTAQTGATAADMSTLLTLAHMDGLTSTELA